jgi:hypothetical protein
MTKRKSKPRKTVVKATAKTVVTKSSAVPGNGATPLLIVLGFDEQQKPRGARFVDAKPDLVIKAADLMGFKVYQASLDDIAAGHLVIAQESLDCGWWEAIVLDRKGDTFTLQYRDYPHLPKFARHRSGVALICSADNEQSWNEIAPGHLVIAQESAKDGWWEAVVIDRKADSLTLQFRDYHQPKIVRHRSAIALMYRANEGHRPAVDQQA